MRAKRKKELVEFPTAGVIFKVRSRGGKAAANLKEHQRLNGIQLA
jgi:UDP-N-acetylenolpyruvoylglucosamine reductase